MSSVRTAEHPAAGMRNTRVAGIVALALVFLCGVAAGAVAHNLLHHSTLDSGVGRALYFDRLQKELDLTPAQSEQVQSVLNDMWSYYRTVLSDSKQRVELLLTPEQRRKFEKLLQEQKPR